eukprot:2675358-Rhodomonas_salina.3
MIPSQQHTTSLSMRPIRRLAASIMFSPSSTLLSSPLPSSSPLQPLRHHMTVFAHTLSNTAPSAPSPLLPKLTKTSVLHPPNYPTSLRAPSLSIQMYLKLTCASAMHSHCIPPASGSTPRLYSVSRSSSPLSINIYPARTAKRTAA